MKYNRHELTYDTYSELDMISEEEAPFDGTVPACDSSPKNKQMVIYMPELPEERIKHDVRRGAALALETAALGGCAVWAAISGDVGWALFLGASAGFVGAHAIEQFEAAATQRKELDNRGEV